MPRYDIAPRQDRKLAQRQLSLQEEQLGNQQTSGMIELLSQLSGLQQRQQMAPEQLRALQLGNQGQEFQLASAQQMLPIQQQAGQLNNEAAAFANQWRQPQAMQQHALGEAQLAGLGIGNQAAQTQLNYLPSQLNQQAYGRDLINQGQALQNKYLPEEEASKQRYYNAQALGLLDPVGTQTGPRQMLIGQIPGVAEYLQAGQRASDLQKQQQILQNIKTDPQWFLNPTKRAALEQHLPPEVFHQLLQQAGQGPTGQAPAYNSPIQQQLGHPAQTPRTTALMSDDSPEKAIFQATMDRQVPTALWSLTAGPLRDLIFGSLANEVNTNVSGGPTAKRTLQRAAQFPR